MSSDSRQSVSRPLLVLQALALVLGLESIEKILEVVEQHFDQTAKSSDTALSKTDRKSCQSAKKAGLAVRRKSVPGAGNGVAPSTIDTGGDAKNTPRDPAERRVFGVTGQNAACNDIGIASGP